MYDFRDLYEIVPRGTKHKWDVDTVEPASVVRFSSALSDALTTVVSEESVIAEETAYYKGSVLDAAEIAIKYQGYIDREKLIADKIARLDTLLIPQDFDFEKVSGLSIECRQKLFRYKPTTIGQASRIPGVSPSDVSVLLVYFGR